MKNAYTRFRNTWRNNTAVSESKGVPAYVAWRHKREEDRLRSKVNKYNKE